MRLTASQRKNKPSRRLARRAAFLAVHKYIGLALGLIIAITGLTGSILVFRDEMEQIGIADIAADPPGPGLGLETAIDVAAAAASPGLYPKRIHLETLHQPSRPWRIELSDSEGSLSDLYLHPVSGEVVAARGSATFLDWIFDLHVYLLAGRPGAVLQGIVAGFLILSAGAGLYLWWPKPGKWKRALRLRWAGATDLKLRELHNVSGIYLLPFIVLAALTGMVMTFPETAQRLAGGVDATAELTGWTPLHRDLGPEAAIAAVRHNYPAAVPELMVLPRGPGGNIGISFRIAGEPHAASRTFVLLHQESGDLLYRLDPRRENFAALVDDHWSFHLHNGELGGLPGRIVAFLTGLALVLLFVSGCWLWIWKRRALARQAERRKRPEQ